MRLTLDLNSAADYRLFLKIKALPTYRFIGREAIVPDEYVSRLGVDTENRVAEPDYEPLPGLFDYQESISRLAIKKRKFAVFARPGLGKTLIMCEFARHAARVMPDDKCVLIISPLMVIKQTLSEAKRFYGDSLEIEQVRAKDLPNWTSGGDAKIGITNFEALSEAVPQGDIGGLIVDECFAPGTPVDCLDASGHIEKVPIEKLFCGRRIVNAAGSDTILRVHKREVPYAIVVKVGKGITCSPNHPFFTRRGWVCAQDLEPGDSISLSGTAVRMVQGRLSPEESQSRTWKVLQSILLSEMEDEPTGVFGEGSHARGCSQARRIEVGMVPVRVSGRAAGTCQDHGIESDIRSGCPGEDFPKTEGDGPRTFRAWGQWPWDDRGPVDPQGCSWRQLDSGILHFTGEADSRLSHELQTRLGQSRASSRYRSGWVLPSQPQGTGQEEGCETGFARVDGIEVLEQGDPRLERLRDASGKLYFYDLEAARHPSFSVNGLLVHNSSIMKSHYGKWGREIIRLGRGLDWKLALTGTPAPNDRIEYANHAIFLDAFPTVNSFLSRYFVNRGQTNERWEMKPHAIGPFYRSLSHWCIFLSDPATYGWKDNVGIIPPVHVHIHDVDLTESQNAAVREITGTMFTNHVGGIVNRSKLARIAKSGDSNKPAFIRQLIESWPDRSTLVWCRYNEEQDRLVAEIPGAASIAGKTKEAERERIIAEFQAGRIKTIVTKADLLGFGLNLQICTRQIFSSLHDSYEEMYQAIMRSNRVGSTEPLEVHIPVTEAERPMIETVLRKAKRVEEDTRAQESEFKNAACL